MARHGAYPEEKLHDQPFDVDVLMRANLSAARKNDSLDDTINYAALADLIIAAVTSTSFNLLERLADHLLDVVMSDNRVVAAQITVSKPERVHGATPSVTVARTIASASEPTLQAGETE